MQPLPQHLQIQLPLPLQPQGLLLPLHQLLPQQRHSQILLRPRHCHCMQLLSLLSVPKPHQQQHQCLRLQARCRWHLQNPLLWARAQG